MCFFFLYLEHWNMVQMLSFISLKNSVLNNRNSETTFLYLCSFSNQFQILGDWYAIWRLLSFFLFFFLDKNYTQEPSPNADGPTSKNWAVLLPRPKNKKPKQGIIPVSLHSQISNYHNWAMENLCWKSLNPFKSPTHSKSWNWFNGFCY